MSNHVEPVLAERLHRLLVRADLSERFGRASLYLGLLVGIFDAAEQGRDRAVAFDLAQRECGKRSDLGDAARFKQLDERADGDRASYAAERDDRVFDNASVRKRKHAGELGRNYAFVLELDKLRV